MESPTPPPTAREEEVSRRLHREQPRGRRASKAMHERDDGLLHVGEEGVESVLLLEELGGAGPSALISELLHKRWKMTAALVLRQGSEGRAGTH